MGQKVSAGWLWWRWGRMALRSHGLQPTPHGSIHQVGWWLLVSGINGLSFSYSLTWPLLLLPFKRQIAPWIWVWSCDSLQPMKWQHVWCHQEVKKRLREGTCRLVHTSHHWKNLQGPCLLVPGRGRGASETSHHRHPTQPLQLGLGFPTSASPEVHEWVQPPPANPSQLRHVNVMNAFCPMSQRFYGYYVAEVNRYMAVNYLIWNALILPEYLKFQCLRIYITLFSTLWHSGFSW